MLHVLLLNFWEIFVLAMIKKPTITTQHKQQQQQQQRRIGVCVEEGCNDTGI